MSQPKTPTKQSGSARTVGLIRKHGKDYYTTRCLNHGEKDPREDDEDDKEDELYYETIIETGFFCYFLIRHYLELDLFDADIGTIFP